MRLSLNSHDEYLVQIFSKCGWTNGQIKEWLMLVGQGCTILDRISRRRGLADAKMSFMYTVYFYQICIVTPTLHNVNLRDHRDYP